jgi:NhaP-type Na+/H+ or K+/H+ antiporter
VQDPHVLQVVVLVGCTVIGLSWLAARLRIASPIVLLLGGLGAFALSYIGGALVGLVVAWLAVRAHNLVRSPLREAAVSLVTPFAAFLLAEELHASGVLAVVVCGPATSQVGPRVIGART